MTMFQLIGIYIMEAMDLIIKNVKIDEKKNRHKIENIIKELYQLLRINNNVMDSNDNIEYML